MRDCNNTCAWLRMRWGIIPGWRGVRGWHVLGERNTEEWNLDQASRKISIVSTNRELGWVQIKSLSEHDVFAEANSYCAVTPTESTENRKVKTIPKCQKNVIENGITGPVDTFSIETRLRANHHFAKNPVCCHTHVLHIPQSPEQRLKPWQHQTCSNTCYESRKKCKNTRAQGTRVATCLWVWLESRGKINTI